MKLHLFAKWGLRGMFKRHNLGFTVTTTLCLGVGIASGVTVFSMANAVLMSPLPGVREPESLVSLTTKATTIPGYPGKVSLAMSYTTFQTYRNENDVFSELAGYQSLPLNVGVGTHRAERMAGQVVSDNYFSTLGMGPAVGRFFSAREHRQHTAPVLVISHALWRRFFAGTSHPSELGPLNVNGQVFEVLGVASRGFRGTVRHQKADLWVPMEWAPLVVASLSRTSLVEADRGWLFQFFGRLKSGVGVAQAQAGLDVLGHRLATQATGSPTPELRVYPYIGIRPGARQDLFAPFKYMSIAVALLMIVLCTNTGGLLLVRLVARQGEIGVRLALGARRSTVVGQLMIEALLLSLLGAVLGLGLALGLMSGLEGAVFGRFLPELTDLSLDGRVLAFTAALTALMTAGFALLPGLWASRPQLIDLVRQASPGRAGRRLWLQEVFVVAQSAAAVILIICAGLVVSTLRSLESVDPGFNPEQIVNLRIDLELLRYETPAGLALFQQLLEAVQSHPGTDYAAFAFEVPFDRKNQRLLLSSVGPVGGRREEQSLTRYNVVSPGYFQTLGIPLIRGDDFSARDHADAPRVIIINQKMAQEFFPNSDPVGQRLLLGETPHEVVGVAENVRSGDLAGEAERYYYRPLSQSYMPQITLHLKSHQDPKSMMAAATAELQKIDPMAVFETAIFRNETRHALAGPRILSATFGGFGLVALFVTVIGTYGVTSYSISRRTRELGVRMALGAGPNQIVTLVARRTFLLTLSGIVAGLGGAFLAARALAALLYGVSPTDPAVFVTVASIGTAVGLAAGIAPAISASRGDLAAALHYD